MQGRGRRSSARAWRVKDALRWRLGREPFGGVARDGHVSGRDGLEPLNRHRRQHVRPGAGAADHRAVRAAAFLAAARRLIAGAVLAAVVLDELRDPARRAHHQQGERQRKDLEKPRHERYLYAAREVTAIALAAAGWPSASGLGLSREEVGGAALAAEPIGTPPHGATFAAEPASTTAATATASTVVPHRPSHAARRLCGGV